MKLRVATYNVHKCAGMDRRISPARIAEVIEEFRPDVIGLQEVLSIEGGRREENQARYLADRLGMHLAIGEVRRLRGGAYGNIVLSRLPIDSSCAFDLTVAGCERRGCLRSDIQLEGGQVLHVFNLHLGTGFLERRAQAQRIVATEWLRGAGPPGPRIALGDFNEWTHGLASRVLAAEFRSADIRLHLKYKRTYPGFFPFLHLDHIYYDADLVLERACLHRTLKSLVASDHLPLYADFALRQE
jgi:endonuclease/exonuclease/phosphatase family metal-dependent hydrolase